MTDQHGGSGRGWTAGRQDVNVAQQRLSLVRCGFLN